MREPVEEDSLGSMGCRYVINSANAAGFSVDYLTPQQSPSKSYDVELVSCHHCTDFPRLKALPRIAPLRIVGGHPTTNNIRPAIPFGDVFCLGEGETWIAHVLARLNDGAHARDLADLPGTIIPTRGMAGEIPAGNTEAEVPKHPPYLNRSGEGHARVWYLEMARGCPFACHYCELGWAWKYRMQDTDWLLEQIGGIDTKQSNRVSLFAPDEASHPGYHAILDRIHQRRMVTSFGSMRLDVIVRKNLPFKSNMLIRVGLDGLTESTRMRVGRKITDDAVWEYFRYMTDRGHHNFKIFMVFGYPWETSKDFDEWKFLWDRISRIPRKKNAHVRIKFTPLIPQPSTPLGDAAPQYHHELAGRIAEWFTHVKTPYSQPGWYVANDGLMGARSHELQCRLTLGDETTLLDDATDWSETETLQGYDVEW